MKTVKKRKSGKDIKALDKSANLSKRMKNSFICTKERAEETQNPRHASPADYAGDKMQNTAQGVAQETVHHLPNPLKKARENIRRAKRHFQGNNNKKIRQQKKYTVKKNNATNKTPAKANPAQDSKTANPAPKSSVSRPSYLNKGVRAHKNAGNSVKPLDKSAKTVKSTAKKLKNTSKRTIKTVNKSVKTAEKTAKQSVTAVQKTVKTAQQTAQVLAKAAKIAAKAAQAASKATVAAAKAAAKAAIVVTKAILSAIQALVAAIAAGGWVVVVVILVICLIAIIIGSVFSIFFSDEPDSVTGMSLTSVIMEINAEYAGKIDDIISENSHDILEISGEQAVWKQTLAVYAIKIVTDPVNPMEAATMNNEKAAILRTVFWNMTDISYILETMEIEEDLLDDDGIPTGERVIIEKVMLRITITHKTLVDITAQYGFTDEQKEWLAELLKPEYDNLWNALREWHNLS